MINSAAEHGSRLNGPVRKYVKVLVIEPDAECCRIIAGALHRHGYQVATTQSGGKGILLMSRDSFHLMVLALTLSDMPWLDVVTAIRKVAPRIGLVATTPTPDLRTARLAMQAGACDYLCRPIAEPQLLAAVERTCQLLGLIHTQEVEVNRMVGQRIRRARMDRQYTLRQLAERTGLTPSQLSQVELGKNAASVWALARISAALGRQISSLLDGI